MSSQSLRMLLKLPVCVHLNVKTSYVHIIAGLIRTLSNARQVYISVELDFGDKQYKTLILFLPVASEDTMKVQNLPNINVHANSVTFIIEDGLEPPISC